MKGYNNLMGNLEAAAYLVKRHEANPWDYSLGRALNPDEINSIVLGKFIEEESDLFRIRLAQGVVRDVDPTEKFITRDDFDDICVLALMGPTHVYPILLNHPFLSGDDTVQIIDSVYANPKMNLTGRQSLLFSLREQGYPADRVLAALYTADPGISGVLTAPTAGSHTINAWIQNPQHDRLIPEDIIALMNRDDIPETHHQRLNEQLEKVPVDRLAKVRDFWQKNLTQEISNLITPEQDRAHLISDQSRSNLIIATTLI